MYASTSEASPRFDPNCASGIDVGFKGALDLLRAWRDGRTPDPELTVSRWAASHRVLSPRGANEAGRWRTSRMAAADRRAETGCSSFEAAVEHGVAKIGRAQ